MSDLNIEVIDRINEMTWIASDHHFGHSTLELFEPSRGVAARIDGFENAEEMLIANHNELVEPDDDVLFLGDFALNGKRAREVLSKLNGNKIIILGNHDLSVFEYPDDVTIIEGLYIEWNGKVLVHEDYDDLYSGIIKFIGDSTIMFSHYALFTNDDYNDQPGIAPRIKTLEEFYTDFDCSCNVHGHLHSHNSKFQDAKNACLEQTAFKPIRLFELLEK